MCYDVVVMVQMQYRESLRVMLDGNMVMMLDPVSSMVSSSLWVQQRVVPGTKRVLWKGVKAEDFNGYVPQKMLVWDVSGVPVVPVDFSVPRVAWYPGEDSGKWLLLVDEVVVLGPVQWDDSLGLSRLMGYALDSVLALSLLALIRPVRAVEVVKKFQVLQEQFHSYSFECY